MGRNNKQAWLMLFDLYQVASNRTEFDALALLFTVKFEQSPPAWSDRGGESPSDPRRAQGRSSARTSTRSSRARTASSPPTSPSSWPSPRNRAPCAWTWSKVRRITPADAQLLAGALTKLRRAKVPMWFNSLEGLEAALRAAFNERSPTEQRPYWSLLFELQILQGKSEVFEELSLEYAVAFEMSPPNWEVYVNTVTAALAKAAPAARARAPAAAPTRASS
jgi:hypothetical protein